MITFLAACQASSPFQEKFISSNGAEIYCRQCGHSDPIIIIHGAPGLTQDYLYPYFAHLSENHLVVFYDQRGCGRSRSELTENQINVPNFINDIEAIRKALNADKITLLGHSWGGFLGMKYAIQYPDAVHKLILLDTMPASQEEFTEFIVEVTKRLAPIHDELQALEATEIYQSGDPETVEKQLKLVFKTYLHDPNNIDKLHFNLTREAFHSGAKVFALLCDQIFLKPYDIFADLPKIKSPTLILHGDNDPISYKMAEHIHQSIPHAQFVKIEHCGHFPFVEQADELFPVIQKFLKE